MSKIYEIDPDADTLVVVRPSSASFAAWPEHDGSGAAARQTSHTNGAHDGDSIVPNLVPTDVRIKVSSKHLSLASPRFRDLLAQTVAARAGQQATDGDKTNGSLTNGHSHGLHHLSNGTTPPPKANGVPPPTSLWRSAQDKAQLSSSPSSHDGPDDRLHLALDDDLDADAVTTVLNILHGRAGQGRVPRSVTLDALARIAAVVDRFQLHDAIDVYAERWLDDLTRDGSTPTRRSRPRDLAMWIYVAYVFADAALFRTATQLAATQLTGPLPPLAGLPLRAKIVHDIEMQRQEAIEQAAEIVAAAVDSLVHATDGHGTGGNGVDFADGVDMADGAALANADTFLLGGLVRAMHGSRLLWPAAAAPFAGVSVAGIAQAAHAAQTQTWRMALRIGDTTRCNRTNNRLRLTPQLDRLRADVAGLSLASELGYSLY